MRYKSQNVPDLQNTMIYVTHDQVEAMTLADKIVVLRDGRVEQVGSILELYHSPQNEFVAGFAAGHQNELCHVWWITPLTLMLNLPSMASVKLLCHYQVMALPKDKSLL